MTPDPALQFYEQLASDYHLIFADWKESVQKQGEILDHIIRAQMSFVPSSVLDCSCGIGTQAIGLAMRGYQVHATDLSPTAVERAAIEAKSFGVSLTFGVADLRDLDTVVSGSFDVVLSCDNALPHLLSREDLLLAAHSMKSKLKPDGLLLVSIRDYDSIVAEKPCSTTPQIIDTPSGRRIVFQVWDWLKDGRTYQIHQFIIRQTQEKWNTAHYTTLYRTLLRDELGQILQDVGFKKLDWLMPSISGYYQPIVVAHNSF